MAGGISPQEIQEAYRKQFPHYSHEQIVLATRAYVEQATSAAFGYRPKACDKAPSATTLAANRDEGLAGAALSELRRLLSEALPLPVHQAMSELVPFYMDCFGPADRSLARSDFLLHLVFTDWRSRLLHFPQWSALSPVRLAERASLLRTVRLAENLKVLDLGSHACCTDQLLAAVAQSCQLLESIKISYSSEATPSRCLPVTDVGLLALAGLKFEPKKLLRHRDRKGRIVPSAWYDSERGKFDSERGKFLLEMLKNKYLVSRAGRADDAGAADNDVKGGKNQKMTAKVIHTYIEDGVEVRREAVHLGDETVWVDAAPESDSSDGDDDPNAFHLLCQPHEHDAHGDGSAAADAAAAQHDGTSRRLLLESAAMNLNREEMSPVIEELPKFCSRLKEFGGFGLSNKRVSKYTFVHMLFALPDLRILDYDCKISSMDVLTLFRSLNRARQQTLKLVGCQLDCRKALNINKAGGNPDRAVEQLVETLQMFPDLQELSLNLLDFDDFTENMGEDVEHDPFRVHYAAGVSTLLRSSFAHAGLSSLTLEGLARSRHLTDDFIKQFGAQLTDLILDDICSLQTSSIKVIRKCCTKLIALRLNIRYFVDDSDGDAGGGVGGGAATDDDAVRPIADLFADTDPMSWPSLSEVEVVGHFPDPNFLAYFVWGCDRLDTLHLELLDNEDLNPDFLDDAAVKRIFDSAGFNRVYETDLEGVRRKKCEFRSAPHSPPAPPPPSKAQTTANEVCPNLRYLYVMSSALTYGGYWLLLDSLPALKVIGAPSTWHLGDEVDQVFEQMAGIDPSVHSMEEEVELQITKRKMVVDNCAGGDGSGKFMYHPTRDRPYLIYDPKEIEPEVEVNEDEN